MRAVLVQLFVRDKNKLTGQFRVRSNSRLKSQLITSNVEAPVIVCNVRYLCMSNDMIYFNLELDGDVDGKARHNAFNAINDCVIFVYVMQCIYPWYIHYDYK